MKVGLIEIANTDNISIINDGNYWLTLPDGTKVSPVYAGWTGEFYMIREIEFDEPIPTYLEWVDTGNNTGSGYVANDVLTVAGGTAVGNTAQLQVYSIGSNGIITSVIIANSGFYTSNPTIDENAPTGGSGTGLTVDLGMANYPISSKIYDYNANTDTVIETNVYGTPIIDNTRSIELQRQNSLEADSQNISLKDKIKTATAAQIDTWLQNNVTDLASARTVLGAIIKFLAQRYPYGR